jgi:hypothetical protein
MKHEFSRQIFGRYPNIKFYEDPSFRSRVNGRTDMTKLIVVIRNLLKHLINPCKLILIVVQSIFCIPVQENQQMLKGVFIILIKLPRHVSAARVGCKERVTPWRWQLAAETCRGNLMSIIKLTTPYSVCWLSCTGIYKNARYDYQDKILVLHLFGHFVRIS